jgi:hypothetical protein
MTDTSKLAGWYTQAHAQFRLTPARARSARNQLPPTLIEYAPLMLVCPVCYTLRLARPDRTLLWHREQRDGVWYECVAVNLPGLLPEEVAA